MADKEYSKYLRYIRPEYSGSEEALKKLIEELFSETPEEKRCPHLRRDKISPYCSNGLGGKPATEARRMVCSTSSLQLWCLDKERCGICIYFKDAGEFKNAQPPEYLN